MLQLARRVAMLVLVWATAACTTPETGESRRFLTIATGGTGGVYYPLGGTLAQVYSRALPGLTASAQATVASAFNVQAVDQGKADLAFAMADVVWTAYTAGTDSRPVPHTNLRGLAVLYINTVQIVARADGRLRGIGDLRGARIGVGAPGSGTEVATRAVVEGVGLSYRDLRADYLSFSEVSAQLQDRTLDAGVLVASFPVAALTDAATTVGVRLLPIEADAASRIRARYPFYKPVTIPKGTYRGLDADLPTIGVDNLLVCRGDLDEALVYDLTRLFFESLSELADTHSAARRIDVSQAAATPIPLHPGAARYYRERGLLP